MKEIGTQAVEVLLCPARKSSEYAAVLVLDRKIRDALMIRSRDVFGEGGAAEVAARLSTGRISTSMQRIVDVMVPETSRYFCWSFRPSADVTLVLLLIHRIYLARAFNGRTANVFGSKYGPSVLASYRSACRVVLLHRILASLGSPLPFRVWFLWNHLLGATVCYHAILQLGMLTVFFFRRSFLRRWSSKILYVLSPRML